MITQESIININHKLIQSNKDYESIAKAIDSILLNIKARSINTYKTYKYNYEEFFNIVLNKTIIFTTWNDILNITYHDILQYRNTLQQQGNSNRTINLKMASLNRLYHELYKMNRSIDTVVVDLQPLPELENDMNTYGSLTEQEVQNLITYCQNLPNNRKPLQKALYFKFAFVTAMRQGAILSLTWDDFSPIQKNGKTVGMLVRKYDKGKINQTPITLELYNELIDMHSKESNIDEQRVFPTTRKTLSKVLKEYCEHVGIDHIERNIVLHSLKKASIDKVYHETKDINITARHGNHKSVEMVYKVYEGRNYDILNSPSFTIFEPTTKEKKREQLEQYSKEELITALMECGDNTINEVLSKL